MNGVVLQPNMLKEMEQEVINIREKSKAYEDRQKSYADQQRMHKEFQVGEHVYLHVKPRKSSLKLGSYAMLAPMFCGSFQILERMGIVAYIFPLPPT